MSLSGLSTCNGLASHWQSDFLLASSAAGSSGMTARVNALLVSEHLR